MCVLSKTRSKQKREKLRKNIQRAQQTQTHLCPYFVYVIEFSQSVVFFLRSASIETLTVFALYAYE